MPYVSTSRLDAKHGSEALKENKSPRRYREGRKRSRNENAGASAAPLDRESFYRGRRPSRELQGGASDGVGTTRLSSARERVRCLAKRSD